MKRGKVGRLGRWIAGSIELTTAISCAGLAREKATLNRLQGTSLSLAHSLPFSVARSR